MTYQIVRPHLLLVEGKDDEGFFDAFLKHLNITNIQVLSVAGKTKIRKNLKALTKTPGFSDLFTLVVVRDADENPDGAFQSVQDALGNAGLPVPDKPFEICAGEPRVMVLILPGQGKTGALEDLCLQAVADDAILYCVEKHLQCLKDQRVTLPKNTGKAKVQIFLGSKEVLKTSLGVAAQAGYWPMDNDVFREIASCLLVVSDHKMDSR